MANQLFIAEANPVKFYWTDRPVDPAKNYFLLGEDWFSKQVPFWYQKMPYFQKWQKTDTINLQVKANFDPIIWYIIDCKGSTVKGGDFDLKYTAIIGQPYKFYEAAIQLADVPAGSYYIVISAGIDGARMDWISEPISVKLQHPETFITEYKHSFNHLDVIYGTGISFYFRCEGNLIQYDPQNNGVVYIDQYLDAVQLSAYPFEGWKLSIGHSYGVPDWVIKKINTIFCFNYVTIEGKQFIRPAGTKMEANRLDEYPMAGWMMDVRPAQNLNSDFADSAFNNKIAITYNIDANLFGTLNNIPENNTIQITQTR